MCSEGLQKVRTEKEGLDFTMLVQKMNYRRKREKWEMRLKTLETGYKADVPLGGQKGRIWYCN